LGFWLSNEGILLNFSPGAKSKGGYAEGDTFIFDQYLRLNNIGLTPFPDALIVNDTTWREQVIEPVFWTGGGNDSIECYTPCTIYGD